MIRLALAGVMLALAGAVSAQAPASTTFEPKPGQPGKDVIWLPTPDDMVRKMLDLAQVAPGERLVDLGSGDGKIAIAAARRGALARGIEYNADMVEFSRKRARDAGVQVDFVQGDIFATDFSSADVVTLYLLDHLNEQLRPTLLAMKPGTRIVSYRFTMGAWEPDSTLDGGNFDAFLWRVPAKIEGDWNVAIGANPGPTVRFEQSFQKVDGRSEWGARAAPLRDATVRGPVVTFVAVDAYGAPHRFEGVADHTGPMLGIVTPASGRGAARIFTATRVRP